MSNKDDAGRAAPPAIPATSSPPIKKLLRPGEAADLLGVSRATVYELMASGGLPSLNLGRCRRIRVEDLDAWVESRVR